MRLVQSIAAAPLLVPPVLAVGTLALMANGLVPGLETALPSGFASLWSHPSFKTALVTSLATAALATLLSYAATATMLRGLWCGALARSLRRWLAPILAIPHAGLAIGCLLLLAPTGLLFRALAQPLGWTLPPAITTTQDPFGLSLVLVLVIKETAFLLFVALAALRQVDARRRLILAQSLGYGRSAAFGATVWPLLRRSLRLPVIVVFIYGLSAVDVALILGPTNPPTLGVLIFTWMRQGDPTLYPQAAAAALLLTVIGGLVGAALTLAFQRQARRESRILPRGDRGLWQDRLLPVLRGGHLAVSALLAGAGLAVLLWSIAGPWRFPDLLPSGWRLASWRQALGGALPTDVAVTAALALGTTMLCLLAVVAALEVARQRRPGMALLPDSVVFAPLLLPQIGIVTGLHPLLLAMELVGDWVAVALLHALFILPYLWLVLGDAWQGCDRRYDAMALSPGTPPWRLFLAVRLPLLAPALITALALGVAVSVAQYLPTAMGGAGRITTVTTEAVALAAGGNRRSMAVYTLLQAMLPLLAFALALIIPGWIYRRRAGMRAE